MVISGKYLPAVSSFSNPADPNRLHQQRSSLENFKDPDFKQHQRQQTVEYVFQGDFDEDFYAWDQVGSPYAQIVDPAKRNAIDSYLHNQTVGQPQTPRQGRIVDIFI